MNSQTPSKEAKIYYFIPRCKKCNDTLIHQNAGKWQSWWHCKACDISYSIVSNAITLPTNGEWI